MNTEEAAKIKVQVGGMASSGSSLLYNIVRMLLEKEQLTNNTQWILVKEHKRLPDQDFYIVTMRDLRDTTASWMLRRKMPKKKVWGETIAALKKNMKWVNEFFYLNGTSFDAKKIHLWKYEEYKANPSAEIQKIVAFLNLQHIDSPTIEEVIKIAENLINISPPHADREKLSAAERSFLDKTKLTKEHASTNAGRIGKYHQFFNNTETNQILELSKDFLTKYGYLENK